MFVRFALLALLALSPVHAQAPAPTPAVAPAVVHVAIETSEGPLVLALEKERAPVTTANFLRYVDEKRLDGIVFYRAMKMAPGSGLIQGGVRDPERLLPPIANEPTTQTGLSHVDGAISMARHAPGSATADFFIIVGDAMTGLDANPAQPGDNLGFAVFGRVVDGMDVVRRILDAPTSATEGEGVMRGQMIADPVRIISARRADPSPR